MYKIIEKIIQNETFVNYQIFLLLIKIFPVTWFLGFPWKSGLYLRTTSPACENIPHPSAVSGNTFRPRYLGTKGSWFFFYFYYQDLCKCINVIVSDKWCLQCSQCETMKCGRRRRDRPWETFILHNSDFDHHGGRLWG